MGSIILGIILIVFAFIVGAVDHFFLGMLGFLSFFVIGVTVIVEGLKRRKHGSEQRDSGKKARKSS